MADLIDRRVTPRGVLPRHLQTWAMLGIAGAMLLVIVVTGRPNAPRRPADAATPIGSLSALPPDRLRRYQEELTQEEARLRHELTEAQAQAKAQDQAAAPANAQAAPPARAPAQPDPIAEERRRREYTSLFAESVVVSKRPGASHQLPVSSSQLPVPSSQLPVTSSQLQAPNTEHAAPSAQHAGPATLLEGTIIEAVLTNRLDGSFSSPANALVTTPVYSVDRQTVLIPAGARVLGTASPVEAFGESRLAVKFHRLVMPDGITHDLDQFTGLNERGDAGVSDQVSRHYLQIFGASIALGSLSGLAQYATRSPSNTDYGFSDAFGQGMGGSLATSSARVLDRFLNVLPTVTIREGHRLKIYITRDIDLSGKGVEK
jgi:type IV secretion system protein VirB10